MGSTTDLLFSGSFNKWIEYYYVFLDVLHDPYDSLHCKHIEQLYKLLYSFFLFVVRSSRMKPTDLKGRSPRLLDSKVKRVSTIIKHVRERVTGREGRTRGSL